MGFGILLAAAVLGFIIVVLQELSSNKGVNKRQEIRRRPTTIGYREYYPPMSLYGQTSVNSLHHEYNLGHLARSRERARVEALIRRVRRPTRARDRAQRTKRNSIVATWHRSVVGLVRLADKNLEQAQQHITSNNYKNSITAASIGVENIARALIHCFGGKPNVDTGQQEPLRMLVSRLDEEEKLNGGV